MRMQSRASRWPVCKHREKMVWQSVPTHSNPLRKPLAEMKQLRYLFLFCSNFINDNWGEHSVKSMLSFHPKGSLETRLLPELEQGQYKTM